GIVDIGDAAAHARREIAPGLAQHHHAAAGHVLAAVIAHAFDHRLHAGITDAEALADHAAQENLAAGCAVADHVAGDDVLLRVELRSLWRTDDDAAAGEALAHVIVGVAFQVDGDALR